MFRKAIIISLAGFFAICGHAAEPAAAKSASPKADARTALPFREGVMAGDTLYVAGHIGLDPATGQAPGNVETEARLAMEAVKQTVEHSGLSMDDLVSVTVYCTDLDLYEQFNAVYRSYFHSQFPARAFIGVNKLVRSAHFEIAGIAVKPAGARKL
jgi:2-iminobutanoate/2-iminopropanoate deaminase